MSSLHMQELLAVTQHENGHSFSKNSNSAAAMLHRQSRSNIYFANRARGFCVIAYFFADLFDFGHWFGDWWNETSRHCVSWHG